MIMRYQRISLEIESEAADINNGRRTNSPLNTNWKTYKEEDEEDEVDTYKNWYMKTGKGISSRFRSPSQNGCNIESTNSCARNQQVIVVGNGGENFLQWGNRKRSRCSRGGGGGGGVITMADDDTSSSSTSCAAQLLNPPVKIQRKLSPANLMPPPPSIPSTSNSNGRNHTGQAINLSAIIPPPSRQNLEERSRSGGGNGPISGRSRTVKRAVYSSSSLSAAKDEIKLNGCSQQLNKAAAAAAVNTSDVNHLLFPLPQGGCSSNVFINNDSNSARGGKPVVGDAVTGGGKEEALRWPKIIIPLSKKEKEEDFLTMKGTKLPYRPRKRPKAIEKSIQSCYPGMWLSGITKDRYEVIEKKPTKKQKKRRGLKGMESNESDSTSE